MSKVLNGRVGVAAYTRHRVEELLREHNYMRRTSMHGRTTPARQWLHSLAARRSDGVILVLSELGSR